MLNTQKRIFDFNEIPKSWASIEEFTQWYISVGMPFFPPRDGGVYVTDVTYSMIIFRHGEFQVEQYFIKPNVLLPPHAHKDFENIIVFLGGEMWGGQFEQVPDTLPDFDNTARDKLHTIGYVSPELAAISKTNFPHKHFALMGNRLVPGTFHSIKTFERGCSFLSIEKWVTTNNYLTSATVAYDGAPLGPMHQESLAQQTAKNK
jgi:hypothetical protein